MRQAPKKKNLQEPQPPLEQDGEDSYRADSDGEDEQIPDDGQYTSSHQSIDLQQYLRNRHNIPSQPSDVNQDDQDDEEQGEEEQPQANLNEKQKKKEEEAKIKEVTSPEKPSKKERVEQKRQQKQGQKNSEK